MKLLDCHRSGAKGERHGQWFILRIQSTKGEEDQIIRVDRLTGRCKLISNLLDLVEVVRYIKRALFDMLQSTFELKQVGLKAGCKM